MGLVDKIKNVLRFLFVLFFVNCKENCFSHCLVEEPCGILQKIKIHCDMAVPGELLFNHGNSIGSWDNKKEVPNKDSTFKYRKAELFFKPKDVYGNPYVIDSLKGISGFGFELGKNRMIIKTKTKKIYFPADSVWGFRIHFPSGGYSYLFRITKEIVLPVAELDSMVIYRTSTGRQSLLYFSKAMDSEIFWLSKDNLRIVYKDNPKFLELLDKNSDWRRGYDVDGKFKYNVVEIYKRSLQNK